DAGSAAPGAPPTAPPATVSSPPTSPSPGVASAATSAPKVAVTLFKNVRIFDGKAEKLTDPSNVMVRGNIIERVSRETIQSPADANVTVIDGGGRTLMPGLIDVHWHAMLIRSTPAQGIAGDVGYNNIAAGGRGDRHAVAGIHHSARRGRTGVWSEAGHRRGYRRWTAHLSLRRRDYDYRRSWRLP